MLHYVRIPEDGSHISTCAVPDAITHQAHTMRPENATNLFGKYTEPKYKLVPLNSECCNYLASISLDAGYLHRYLDLPDGTTPIKKRIRISSCCPIWFVSSTMYVPNLNNALSLLRKSTEPNCALNHCASALTGSLHSHGTVCQRNTLIRSRYKSRFAESKHNNEIAV
jgi:hypothetical protein